MAGPDRSDVDAPGQTYRFGRGKSTKLSGPALAPDDVGPIDVVLLSHDQHGDNLDDAGRVVLATTPTVITTKVGARRLGGGVRGLDPWEVTRLDGAGKPTLEVTATPCRHGPPLSRPIVGQVIGFALRWDGQRNGVLWVSGDTVLYNGVRGVADRLDVDIAIVHVGEVQFPITGPVRYSMTARDAIELCRAMRPRVAIPVHYEGWSHFQGAVLLGVDQRGALPTPRFVQLRSPSSRHGRTMPCSTGRDRGAAAPTVGICLPDLWALASGQLSAFIRHC